MPDPLHHYEGVPVLDLPADPAARERQHYRSEAWPGTDNPSLGE
jgi:hypothetical protein